MKIYVDVLVLMNFGVNLILISICSKAMGLRGKKLRMFLGALVGGFGALWIFVPPMPVAIRAGYKILLTMCVSAIAFGIRPWQKYLRGMAGLIITGGIFTGIMMLWENLFEPKWFYRANEIIYAPVRPMRILVFGAGIYLLTWLLWPLFMGSRDTGEEGIREIEVQVGGERTRLRVLTDSGNLLREPFSGKRVMVCRPDVIKTDGKGGIRLIPCETVTGRKLLKGMPTEEAYWIREGEKREMEAIYIAIGEEAFGQGYDGVIHPGALEEEGQPRKERKRGKEHEESIAPHG